MRTPKVRPENGKCAKNQAKGRKNQPFPCENRQFQRLDFWQSELFSVSLGEVARFGEPARGFLACVDQAAAAIETRQPVTAVHVFDTNFSASTRRVQKMVVTQIDANM